MQESLNAWQRLESVIEWAGMTTNFFARYIGLSRGENLYQIKKGNNGISQKTAMMISRAFPEINILWLLTGEGSMFQGAESATGSKPLYNISVEQNIRNIDSIEPDQQLILPQNIDFDLAFLYLGLAMGDRTPPNSVVLLKKILPEMIIPGDECVIVTKKVVLLRIARIEARSGEESILHLTAARRDQYGDLILSLRDVEAVYAVKGKILTNI